VDPLETLVRDVQLLIGLANSYRKAHGRWPSIYALAKILANLSLSGMLGDNVLGYPSGFKWRPGRHGGYVGYDSIILKPCSFEAFLGLATGVAAKMGFDLTTPESGEERIVRAEHI
jgi:hypothetical protein